ncbi:MAG TPA: MaoC family dehydratase N-terminal domain-containing protein [Gemmatimonadaceae bacterium]|nr:MaoC family dehydratase N-terminal domain-containing protein [Gemmatimonadaceae bacterium]
MIDRSLIGRSWPAFEVEIEKGRLRLLAKAIGETRPIYTDEGAARAAGYRSIVAPPTFAFCVLADAPGPTHYLADVGIPVEEVLHGEQGFTFHAVMCAGDRVRVTRRVIDVYDRKGGALEFVVFESEVRFAGTEELAATGRQVMIWRHR